jgi:hypothetical protein
MQFTYWGLLYSIMFEPKILTLWGTALLMMLAFWKVGFWN